ncbi:MULTISPECIES: ABC transporter substrate-binding protein [unclassified Tessaracoccus]|uniref:ABC transporter substrate-binding protein n=1 Tax=unclassified Tessaracoccus TaxID=2635419 RepID=UPI001600A38E|nr:MULTISPECIES: ABC transporter substrate-binding protein [unclassified Tessaracoccus]MBB1512482.1 ABC transporter substrate-binding protein [Tessaracoccus sp. MC1627]MBB1516618.1 ABC transporter substrate-binding protein [Tessaracoccus sp. MC1679]
MKLKALAIGAASALALTACGGTTSPATSPAESTVAASSSAAESQAAPESISVGIATIVSHPALDAAQQGFIDALAEAGYVEGENAEFDLQNAQGDQSTLTNIANTFASSDYDGFLAIATPTAQSLANVITDRPIVFAAVTDPVEAGLVSSWDAPDANITGVSDLNPMKEQLELIKEALPEVATVGIVYSSGEVNSEVQVTEAEEAAGEMGIEIVSATVTNSSEVQQAAESLDVDAYLIPTDNTVVSAAESLIQVAEQKQKPVFASDESTMERGAAAGLSVNYTQQGKDAAAVFLKLLEGTPASEIAVETQKEFDLFVNVEGAAKQGLTLPEAIVSRATKQF